MSQFQKGELSHSNLRGRLLICPLSFSNFLTNSDFVKILISRLAKKRYGSMIIITPSNKLGFLKRELRLPFSGQIGDELAQTHVQAKCVFQTSLHARVFFLIFKCQKILSFINL